MFLKKFLITPLLMIITACTNAVTSIEDNANNFCESYNPKHRSHLPKNASLQDAFSVIWKVQEQFNLSEEFKEAIDGSKSSGFDDYYDSVKINISQLLGSKWECQHFDAFYNPKINAINFTLHGMSKIELNNPNNILIEFGSSGEVFINGSELKTSSKKIIEAAIQDKSKNLDPEKLSFIIHGYDKVSVFVFKDVMEVFEKLKIKNFSISVES